MVMMFIICAPEVEFVVDHVLQAGCGRIVSTLVLSFLRISLTIHGYIFHWVCGDYSSSCMHWAHNISFIWVKYCWVEWVRLWADPFFSLSLLSQVQQKAWRFTHLPELLTMLEFSKYIDWTPSLGVIYYEYIASSIMSKASSSSLWEGECDDRISVVVCGGVVAEGSLNL